MATTGHSDGRRKPEIFAPGCNITLVYSGWRAEQILAVAPPVGRRRQQRALLRSSASITPKAGTPRARGSLTMRPRPSEALLNGALLNATLDMAGIAGYPGSTAGPGLTNQEGWG